MIRNITLMSLAFLAGGIAKAQETGSLYINDFSIKAGETVTIGVNKTEGDPQSYYGFQFDLELPEGLNFESASLNSELLDCSFVLELQENPKDAEGKVRLLGRIDYSNILNAKASDLIEELVNITISSDKDILDNQNGDKAIIKITDVIFTPSSGQALDGTGSECSVTYLNVPVTNVEITPTPDPDDPDDPNNPVNPTDPDDPNNPDNPDDPNNPPTDPDDPDDPENPDNPNRPGTTDNIHYNIFVGQSITLSANVNEDATYTEITWNPDQDTEYLYISATTNSIKITGRKVSDDYTTITATAENGLYSEIFVKVIEMPEVTLSLSATSLEGKVQYSDKKEMKVSGQMKFNAKISPSYMSRYYKTAQWSVEPANTNLAEISNSGLLTAMNKGNITVNVDLQPAGTLTSPLNGSYSLTINDIIWGDSNDDAGVDVADVITTGNYIVDQDLYTFCFANANVIVDDEVDELDLTETINISMGRPTVHLSLEGEKISTRSSEENSDCILMDDYDSTDASLQIGVKMQNYNPYVCLSAEFLIPEGMKIEDVTLGNRALYHTVLYNVSEKGVLKVLLFSLTNSEFSDADDNLFTIKASAEGCNEPIKVVKISATTADVKKYELGFRGGNDNLTAGVSEIKNKEIEIISGINCIYVSNASGENLKIYDVNGAFIKDININDSSCVIEIPKGMYILKSGSSSYKTLVK